MKSRPDPPSLLDLAVDYRQGKMKEEIWTDWGSVVFYRPLGFVCVFLLARLGVEGNMVTLSGVLLLPFMVWGAFTLTPDHALIFVCALGALYCTLDCVDGSLARLARQTSAFGQFVDFAADLTYRVVIYICLGHIADRLAPPPEMMLAHNWSWLSVMLLTACLTLFLRLARNYSDGLNS